MSIYSKNYLFVMFLSSMVALTALTFSVVASSKNDIVHPVHELDDCRDESECRAFCDSRDNLGRVKACVEFAKKHNLLAPDELKEAEYYVLTLGVTNGPGGCKNQKECNTYCEDTDHLTECLDFAEEHGIRSREEIADGRKLAVVLKGGGKLPGGCKEKKACEAYCEESSHMKECVDFAEKAGFISGEEVALARKIIPLLEKGERTPGNCARKSACEIYCEDVSHIDECIAFAEKTGLIPAEELADAKKFAPYIKRGETPGGCTRKDSCEAYCSDTAHFEECVLFAEKAGLMSKEDIDLARKVNGTGPGGCKSKNECEEFCINPENQETCINFAQEHGLTEESKELEAKIRRETEEKVKGEIEIKMKACAEKSCQEFIACLQVLNKGGNDSGEGNVPADIQTKLNICIEEIKKALTPEDNGDVRNQSSTQNPPSAASSQYQEEYQKQYDAEIQQYCHLFEAAPKCEYAAEPGSRNYDICKKCFPNK